MVLYGEGAYDTSDGSGQDAETAARRLDELGYRDVSLLAGGLDAWIASGGELFSDVNAPSKAFGELVAELTGTPLLPAEEVAQAYLDWEYGLVAQLERDGTHGFRVLVP